jgi:hypothetical protein
MVSPLLLRLSAWESRTFLLRWASDRAAAERAGLELGRWLLVGLLGIYGELLPGRFTHSPTVALWAVLVVMDAAFGAEAI